MYHTQRRISLSCSGHSPWKRAVAGVAMFVFQQRRARMHECAHSLVLLDGEWMVVGCALTVACRFFWIRNTWVCMYVWWCACLKLFEDNVCKSETGCNECHLKSAADWRIVKMFASCTHTHTHVEICVCRYNMYEVYESSDWLWMTELSCVRQHRDTYSRLTFYVELLFAGSVQFLLEHVQHIIWIGHGRAKGSGVWKEFE